MITSQVTHSSLAAFPSLSSLQSPPSLLHSSLPSRVLVNTGKHVGLFCWRECSQVFLWSDLCVIICLCAGQLSYHQMVIRSWQSHLRGCTVGTACNCWTSTANVCFVIFTGRHPQGNQSPCGEPLVPKLKVPQSRWLYRKQQQG
jgi:hypothetical protein